MDKYRFRRQLWVDDPDPALEWTKEKREAAEWSKQIDGKFVTQIDENGQWWVEGCKVNRDWCEKSPHLEILYSGDDAPKVA